MLYLLWGNGGPPTKCLSWSELGPQIASLIPKILRCIDFGVLDWNCLFTPHFGEFLRHILTSSIVVTPKRTFLGRKHVVWAIRAIQRKNQCDGSTWTRDREKIQDNKKVTKVLYFFYLGEAPTGPIRPKSCLVGDIHDMITCAKFQTEIFMGYYFTGGRIFWFSYWFLHGPYNSEALLRCLWTDCSRRTVIEILLSLM